MKRILLVFLILFMVIGFLIHLLLPTDKKRIQNLIYEGKEAIIEKNIEKTMDPVALDYHDRYGFNYLGLKRFLARLFSAYDSFEIKTKKFHVDVKDNKAEAGLQVKMIGIRDNQREFILGSDEVFESVIFFLEKRRLSWKVTETYLPLREGLI